MEILNDPKWWIVLIGGIATLAIYSFLYEENPFYRFFEHLYIGIATGIGVMATFRDFLWPQAIRPLLGLDVTVFPDGTIHEPFTNLTYLLLIPMAFGCLYYFILTKKYSWLAQIVIGFSLGVSGGLAFKGVLNEMLPQIIDSFRPLYIDGDVYKSLSNVVFVGIMLTVLSYFFFTFKQKPGGITHTSSTAGRYMMMGCFGAFFGSTVMARLALLGERLQFLIEDWWPAIGVFFS